MVMGLENNGCGVQEQILVLYFSSHIQNAAHLNNLRGKIVPGNFTTCQIRVDEMYGVFLSTEK